MFLAYFLFLSVVLLVILSSHWFFYFSVVRFFEIERRRGVKIVFYLGIIFSAVFILSSFLARVDNGWLIRLFYISSSLWLGFLINFILAVAILWVIKLIHKSLKIQFNFQIVAVVVFTLSFSFSVWGIYHAMDVRVNRVSVSLENLPVSWQGKKIMQISDTHFGQVYGVKSVQKIIDLVKQEKPDAVVITGDLLDGTDGDMDQLMSYIGRIQSPLGVYFTSGNHDYYAGQEKLEADLEKVGIHVLANGFVDLEGLQLAGINYAFQVKKPDYLKVISSWDGYSENKPTILLHHIPDNLSAFSVAGIDLVLSGHTHRGQLFPFGLITDTVFAGYDHGLNLFGDMQVYTSSGAATWGPPMRTSSDSEVVMITLK